MTALEQKLHLVRKKLTPAQVEERRREAEKLLGRTLPPRRTPAAADK
ncbi:hypothetical protein ACFXPS_42700 [Nocardia sp. NPDC059091]